MGPCRGDTTTGRYVTLSPSSHDPLRRAPASDGQEQRATTLELFYDLVFVFAITQVSHLLLEHLTWEGAGQSALVLLVVWWSWNYTTWVDQRARPGRRSSCGCC